MAVFSIDLIWIYFYWYIDIKGIGHFERIALSMQRIYYEKGVVKKSYASTCTLKYRIKSCSSFNLCGCKDRKSLLMIPKKTWLCEHLYFYREYHVRGISNGCCNDQSHDFILWWNLRSDKVCLIFIDLKVVKMTFFICRQKSKAENRHFHFRKEYNVTPEKSTMDDAMNNIIIRFNVYVFMYDSGY